MNAGTPTSAAPGVSVRGRMRSAIAPASDACAGVKRVVCAAGLTPSTTDSHSADSTTPAASAARRMASRRLMPGAGVCSDAWIHGGLTGSAC